MRCPPPLTPFPYTTLFRSALGPGPRLGPRLGGLERVGQPLAKAEELAQLPVLGRHRGLADEKAGERVALGAQAAGVGVAALPDRKSTRLNSSHLVISYSGF